MSPAPALLARDSIIATSASLATTTWSTTRSRHDGLPSVSRVPTCRLPAPGHRVAARRAVSKAADHLKGATIRRITIDVRYSTNGLARSMPRSNRHGPPCDTSRPPYTTRPTARSTPRPNRHGPPCDAHNRRRILGQRSGPRRDQIDMDHRALHHDARDLLGCAANVAFNSTWQASRDVARSPGNQMAKSANDRILAVFFVVQADRDQIGRHWGFVVFQAAHGLRCADLEQAHPQDRHTWWVRPTNLTWMSNVVRPAADPHVRKSKPRCDSPPRSLKKPVSRRDNLTPMETPPTQPSCPADAHEPTTRPPSLMGKPDTGNRGSISRILSG